MNTLLIIIALLACVLLVLIVLIQNPKGGGLSSNFSASNNIMGVQRTGDILEKGTWVLAITIMVLAVLININASNSGSGDKSKSIIQEQLDKTATPGALPLLPGKSGADTSKK